MSFRKDQKQENSQVIDEQKTLEEAETTAKLAPNEIGRFSRRKIKHVKIQKSTTPTTGVKGNVFEKIV